MKFGKKLGLFLGTIPLALGMYAQNNPSTVVPDSIPITKIKYVGNQNNGVLDLDAKLLEDAGINLDDYVVVNNNTELVKTSVVYYDYATGKTKADAKIYTDLDYDKLLTNKKFQKLMHDLEPKDYVLDTVGWYQVSPENKLECDKSHVVDDNKTDTNVNNCNESGSLGFGPSYSPDVKFEKPRQFAGINIANGHFKLSAYYDLTSNSFLEATSTDFQDVVYPLEDNSNTSDPKMYKVEIDKTQTDSTFRGRNFAADLTYYFNPERKTVLGVTAGIASNNTTTTSSIADGNHRVYRREAGVYQEDDSYNFETNENLSNYTISNTPVENKNLTYRLGGVLGFKTKKGNQFDIGGGINFNFDSNNSIQRNGNYVSISYTFKPAKK